MVEGALHAAVIADDRRELEKLLAGSPALDGRDEEGLTPLHLAARHGRLACAKRLLEAGAAVDGLDGQGRSALARALEGMEAGLVRRFDGIEDGVRFRIDHGRLEIAGREAAPPLREVRRLCRRVAPGHLLFLDAAAVASHLLRLGADGSFRDDAGRSALHRAAALGHLGLVRTLARRGLDPLAVAFDGRRPLHLAAEAGAAELVAWLLARGADPSLPTTAGNTARELALAAGHAAVAALFPEPTLVVDEAVPAASEPPALEEEDDALLAAAAGRATKAALVRAASAEKRLFQWRGGEVTLYGPHLIWYLGERQAIQPLAEFLRKGPPIEVAAPVLAEVRQAARRVARATL
ncbi:MAG: ankyrin repeat domain-containing protein [Polyangiaceae bacterium]